MRADDEHSNIGIMAIVLAVALIFALVSAQGC